MILGVAYYPEYNKKEKWAEHFKKIRDAGIERVRTGEFAWSYIQPAKDTFNWTWMDEAIEMAESYGIEIILGTPTACPPVWLVQDYPEVLPVNKEGRRSGFGARQHRCFNSTAYLKYSKIIVEALVERYGRHKNVVAWQIDNELGGEQKRCYCNNCRKAFHEYLKDKYHSIDELNERWMNHFWSQDYQDWSQIPVPMRFASDMEMRHHPSLELEFSRFSSDSIVAYSNMQAMMLRMHTDREITTNTDTFRFGDNVNIYDLFKNLNVGGMDIYSDQLHEIAFYSDLSRSLKKNRFWMMEYGTGNVNLLNEMKLIRDRGCEMFCFFTFVPFPAGQEQGFRGLVTITEELEPNYSIVKNWKQQEEDADEDEGEAVRHEVGLFYNFDSSWAYWLETWASNIEDKQVYPKYMVNTLYRSLFEEDLKVQFGFTYEHIKNFKILILPWQIIHNPDLEDSIIDFVKNGGKLIVTSDLFRKNEDNVFLTRVPKVYRELLGWYENNFISENEIEGSVIRINKVGDGKVWMVKRLLGIEEWKRIIREIKS